MKAALGRIVGLYASAQFMRFLAVGGVALILHWLSRFAFNMVVGYGSAIVLAYLVGMAVAFVLNKIFVFPYSDRPVGAEAFLFFLVNIAAFPFVWLVAYVLGEKVLAELMPRDIALAVAHGFAITLPVFVNFILHKFVTFRGA